MNKITSASLLRTNHDITNHRLPNLKVTSARLKTQTSDEIFGFLFGIAAAVLLTTKVQQKIHILAAATSGRFSLLGSIVLRELVLVMQDSTISVSVTFKFIVSLTVQKKYEL